MALFDSIAVRYDELYRDNPVQRRAVDDLLSRLAPGSRVLDVGCGSGRPVAESLLAAGMRVVGVDPSPVMLELAARNCPDGVFVAGDALNLPADPAPFDAAVAHLSLVMLPRADILRALHRIHGRLAPTGLLSLIMVDHPCDQLPVRFLGKPMTISGWAWQDLATTVAQQGFHIVTACTETFEPRGEAPERQAVVLAQRQDD